MPPQISNPNEAVAEPLVPDTEPLLDVLTRDFQRLQEQKARASGGVEARTLQAIAFSEGEQYTDYKQKSLFTEPQNGNKLYLTFNLIGRRIGKLLGRLSAVDPPFKVKPDKVDPKAYAMAEVGDQLIFALDQKLDQPSRNWELLYWLIHGGVAFEYVPWVPNATIEPKPQFAEDGQTLLWKDTVMMDIIPEFVKDQRVNEEGRAPEQFAIYEKAELDGDVGSEIFGPLNVFMDQSVRSVEDLAPDQRVYVARIRTMGWIKDNFGVEFQGDKDFKILSSTFMQNGDATGGHFLQDLIPLVQGTASDDDPAMAVVVESYAPASLDNPRGRFTVFVPNKLILHDDENPYEDIPLVDYHWKPVTTTFWTGNYVSDLIAPQRFINKRLSQLGEQSNATIYSTLLLGGALKASDIPADTPGAVEGGIADNGQPLAQRLAPPELPSFFMDSINLTVKLFNDIAGGSDLMEEHKFPGQLRGPMAVPMLQEIMDTEWGPFFKHFAERMAKVKQMRLNRVKQFYPPTRTMHYTSRSQRDEVLVFHTDEVLRADVNFYVTVEPGVILPELRALREARLRERLESPLSVLYMDERTGKLDKSKIAQDLQFGDTGRENREGQYRKLAMEINEMLWEGTQVPPVLPFYEHAPMMDELEAAMATTEFLRSSPPTQQVFMDRWNQHRQFLIQEAEARQQSMQNGAIQNAVAQATQQAAAMAAADAVREAQEQTSIQNNMESSGQTRQMVNAAQSAPGKRPQSGPPGRR